MKIIIPVVILYFSGFGIIPITSTSWTFHSGRTIQPISAYIDYSYYIFSITVIGALMVLHFGNCTQVWYFRLVSRTKTSKKAIMNVKNIYLQQIIFN